MWYNLHWPSFATPAALECLVVPSCCALAGEGIVASAVTNPKNFSRQIFLVMCDKCEALLREC